MLEYDNILKQKTKAADLFFQEQLQKIKNTQAQQISNTEYECRQNTITLIGEFVNYPDLTGGSYE